MHVLGLTGAFLLVTDPSTSKGCVVLAAQSRLPQGLVFSPHGLYPT